MCICFEHVESHVDGLREAYFRHVQAALEGGAGRDPARRAALACLADWGFDLTRLDRLPIGYFSSPGLLREELLGDGFSAEEIAASHVLCDPRLAGRLVGPIRDAQGRIVSFWARNPDRPDDRTLYLSSGWKQEAAVFGLDVARPAVEDDRHDLLLVEDLFDALLLHSRGIRHVAAIGGSAADMTEVRWERLAGLGVHRVTLASDGPHTSARAMLVALGRAARARTAPAVYVLPPEALAEPDGIRRLVRSMTPDALADLLVRERIHGFRYKAQYLIAKHKQADVWTDAARHALVCEAVEFYTTVNQRCIPQLDLFFLPTILEELGLGWDIHGEPDAPAWSDDAPADDVSADEVSAVDAPAVDVPAAATNGSDDLALHQVIETATDLGVACLAPVVCEDAAELGATDVSPVLLADTQEVSTILPPPTDEPPVVSAPAVAASAPSIEPPESDALRPRQRLAVGFCEIHQCSRNFCLCWD